MAVEPSDVVLVRISEKRTSEECLDGKVWPESRVHASQRWPQATHHKVTVDSKSYACGTARVHL